MFFLRRERWSKKHVERAEGAFALGDTRGGVRDHALRADPEAPGEFGLQRRRP